VSFFFDACAVEDLSDEQILKLADTLDLSGFSNLLQALKKNNSSPIKLRKAKFWSKLEVKFSRLQDLELRWQKLAEFDNQYFSQFDIIAGCDEAGRGPLAGPVVAAVVVLPKNYKLLGLNDSKQLTAAQRNFFFEKIRNEALDFGIGIVDNKTIDEINILRATQRAAKIAFASLKLKVECLLTDALKIPDLKVKQVPIIKGDCKSNCIAAASILAKVTRDKIMEDLDKLYPAYNFKKNKGYGTAEHCAIIKKIGASDMHRKTFIAKLLNAENLRLQLDF